MVIFVLASLTTASLIVLQTRWFSDYARSKLTVALEESTGAKVTVGDFHLELSRLVVIVRDIVIHGSEAANTEPLAQVNSVYVRFKLFGGLRKALDLADLRIEKPRVNVVTNADGSTNIPVPRTSRPANSPSPLSTVVDLAAGIFRLDNGVVHYTQRTFPLSVKGTGVNLSLDYNTFASRYQGVLHINALDLSSGANNPLNVSVDVPIQIRRNGIDVMKAQFDTHSSHLLLNASLDNASSPRIAIRADGKVLVSEVANAIAIPIGGNATASQSFVTIQLDGQFDESAAKVTINHLQLALRGTHLEASGTSEPSSSSTIHFSGNASLGEFSQLLRWNSPLVNGDLHLQGEASLDSQKNYRINGNIDTSQLSFSDGGIHLSNVYLSTPFRITPERVSLDSLRVAILGGAVSGQLLVESMRNLTARGQIRGVSLSSLSALVSKNRLGYGAVISGPFSASDDLKASLFNATTNLRLTPTSSGVPLKGQINANYQGATQLVSITRGTIDLPASRIKVSGSLDRSIAITLRSTNLRDFAPLLRTTMPVTLKAGEAMLDAQVHGSLSTPRLTGHATVTHFVVQDRLFDALSLDFAASPEGIAMRDGSLRRNTMEADFDGSLALVNWEPASRSPVSTNLTLRNADLGDLLALANRSGSDSSGKVTADVHIRGTYSNPLGAASVQIASGVALGQSFDGLNANVTLTDQSITLNAFQASTAGGNIAVNGIYQHPPDRLTSGHTKLFLRTSGIDLSRIARLQQENAGVKGSVTFSLDAAGNLLDKNGQSHFQMTSLNGQLSANGLRVRDQNAGSFSANISTSTGDVIYTVRSNFAGSDINVDGRTSLASDYRSNTHASIRNLPVQNALALAGEAGLPVSGLLTADGVFTGDLKSPDATLNLELTKAVIYHEPVSQLTARVHYSKEVVDLPLFNLSVPAGQLNLTGRYYHPNDLTQGTLQAHLTSSNLALSRVKQIQVLEPGLSGSVRLSSDISATIHNKGSRLFDLSSMNADVSATGLRLASRLLGDLTFAARTNQNKVTFRLDSNFAQSEIHSSGVSQLTADYPTLAETSFKNLRYQNITPFVVQNLGMQLPFDALIEGKAQLNGPVLNRRAVNARLELSRLEITPNQQRASAPKSIRLQNDQPIIASLDKQVLTVQRFAMRGPNTTLDVTGIVNLADSTKPLHLNLNGSLDLGILQDLDRDFYSSGQLALNTAVGGSVSTPSLNGQLSLHRANVNYANAPNGLSAANGVILLSGTTAIIKSLKGESGGGQIDLAGSFGLTPTAVVYNLRGQATHVRTRYGSASITSSAHISLTGNNRRSVLSGKVTVERIAYSSSSDIGSFLSNASTPPSTSEPSALLAGMRLDIDITTASDLRVSTAYVEKIEVNSHLTLRGTGALPGLIGHLNVTDGQLVFFGNTYTVNHGSIDFYDATAIRPILNLSLETVAQGVDVTLGVSGPVSDMKLSYRSDPPLTFEQIVQLLATNTTPFDPTIAAHQPTPPAQSFSQMGESQVLGAAIANPLASRVQRVFGLTQFKIDPSVAGTNGQPTAKVTLRQKITNKLTFTYITDVTQTNSQIVRVQWDLSSRASAVALRDYNGNVSVQLFYKFQIR